MVWPLKHSLLSVGIFTILYILPICNIYAQDQVVFSHLSVNDGLSQSTIRAITQDHTGILWVGTKNGGLNRYDRPSGKFTHYFYQDTIEQDLQIPTSVNVIFEDSEGLLYVGLNDGVGLYDRQSDSFTSLFSDLSLQLAGVTDICEDNLGNLYFGTQDRLIKYNKRTAATSRFILHAVPALLMTELRHVRDLHLTQICVYILKTLKEKLSLPVQK